MEMFDESFSKEIDFSSSFESSSECDLSFDKTPPGSPLTSFNFTDDHVILDIPENTISTIEYPSNSSFRRVLNVEHPLTKDETVSGVKSNKLDSSGKSLYELEKEFDQLSLVYEQIPSNQLQELKKITSETNDAYASWMSSQFIVDIYKASLPHVPSQLAKKVKEIMTLTAENLVLKDDNGKSYNFFGLEDDEVPKNISLSSLEKEELRKQASKVMKSNLQRIDAQKKALSDMFGAHCEKVVQAGSILCEEREKLAEMRQSVQSQLDEACQLLVSNSQLMQELANVSKGAEQDLQQATFKSLLDKTTYLQNIVSKLKLKMEHSLYKDKNHTKSLNAVGSELKSSTEGASEELKSLKKKLWEYEKKQETSQQYKEIVANYAKVKLQLHHKYQTLSVLNDPDISFS